MVIYSVNKTSMFRFQHVQTTQWLDLAQMKSIFVKGGITDDSKPD